MKYKMSLTITDEEEVVQDLTKSYLNGYMLASDLVAMAADFVVLESKMLEAKDG